MSRKIAERLVEIAEALFHLQAAVCRCALALTSSTADAPRYAELVVPHDEERVFESGKPVLMVRRRAAQPEGWVRIVYQQPRLDN